MEKEKPQKLHIDAKDREILNELQENCKQPVRKIAKKLGLRVTTTYDRIRRMEKLGVIKGYTARLEASTVGVPSSAYILISLSPHFQSTQPEIAVSISKLRGVQECHLITGDYDMIVKVRSEDLNKIGRIILNEIRLLDGVDRTTTMAILESFTESGPVPL